MRNLPRVIGIGAIVLMAVAGCGDADSTDAGPGTATDSSTTTESDPPTSSAPGGETTSPAASTLPACTDVWVAGEDLPSGYQGCFDGTVDVKAEKSRCSSGQTLVTFDDTFWAVSGAEIHETAGLSADSDFQDAKQSCLA